MFVKYVQISTTIYLITTFQISVGPLNRWFIGHMIMWFKGPINSHFYIFRSSSSNLQYFSTFQFLAIRNNRCALQTNRRNFFCSVICLCTRLQVLATKFTFFDQILNPDISQKPCKRIQPMSITKSFLII